MIEILMLIIGVAIVVLVACASLFVLPVVLVVGAIALLFSGVVAGAELIVGVVVAIAALIAAIVFLHLLIPLLIPVLLVCGMVYVVKHVYKAVA